MLPSQLRPLPSQISNLTSSLCLGASMVNLPYLNIKTHQNIVQTWCKVGANIVQT